MQVTLNSAGWTARSPVAPVMLRWVHFPSSNTINNETNVCSILLIHSVCLKIRRRHLSLKTSLQGKFSKYGKMSFQWIMPFQVKTLRHWKNKVWFQNDELEDSKLVLISMQVSCWVWRSRWRFAQSVPNIIFKAMVSGSQQLCWTIRTNKRLVFLAEMVKKWGQMNNCKPYNSSKVQNVLVPLI